MQKYNGQLIRQFASNITGNAASGVTVTVRRQSDAGLATLYVDNNIAGATLPNPITTTDKGFFAFYAADGVYTLTFSDGTPVQIIQLQDVAGLQDYFENTLESQVSDIQNIRENITEDLPLMPFAVVGERNERTWLEVDFDGAPTEYSAERILEKLPLFEEIPLPNSNTQAFAVVGDNLSRSWIEADANGSPTDYSVEKMIESLPDFATLEDISYPLLNKQSFAIVGDDDTRTWLESDSLGKPTDYSIEMISEKLGKSDAAFYTDSTGISRRVSSGPNIVAWGDSMTAGATGVPYTDYLTSLLSADGKLLTISNQGVGGESSATIAARANGSPFVVNIIGGTIPSSGRAYLNLLPVCGVTLEPFRQAGSMPCVLSGIDGIFGAENNAGNYSYFFDRTTTGTSKSVTRPVTIYTKVGNDRSEDICIIWIGQNLVKWLDSANNTNEKNLQRTIQDVKAIIRNLKTLDKRYLVISKPSGDNATNNREDDVFYSEFGDKFIAIRQYITTPIFAGDGTTIINCYGLQDAGISPTSGDLTEIANGSIPQSFRNDSVHWKAAGYEVLAKVIYRKLNELGWV